MDGQMTIWDISPTSELDDIPEAEMVEIVGNAIGVKFKWIEAKRVSNITSTTIDWEVNGNG